VHIAGHLLDQIFEHARESAPAECFGFLVGRLHEGGHVFRVFRGTNLAKRPECEYLMDSAEFIQVEGVAERAGWQVIGFYHSHPDGSVRPSAQDVAEFWPDSTYLIVAVVLGQVVGISGWRLSVDAQSAVRVDLDVDALE